ncbi:lytic transglycosylase domain-containing protein [Candidatus Gracilibacteria bacterium]|nr:lytic transglycosylase domain-containing protein [Candidatus Gracilibacteria bacterium]
MPVFYKSVDALSYPPEKIPNGREGGTMDTKLELAILKNAIQGEKDMIKRKELQRKLSRMELFDRLQDGTDTKDEKTKEDIQKILKGKNTETYSNSDLLTLRKKNIDIASLTLVNRDNPDTAVKSNELKSGDSFTVNFGSNPSLREHTGAGDILPPSVHKVRINGVDCKRNNSPRPGYYDPKGKYQRIYDGYTIEIMGVGVVKEEDNKANEMQWKKSRMSEMEDNDGKVLANTEEDTSLVKEYEERVTRRLENREKFKNYNPENRDKFMKFFGDIVQRETTKYGIPEKILVDNLFARENAKFDPSIKNPYSSAHGFGQIISGTWKLVEDSILFEDLDRNNPEDQIRATCAYLSHIKNLKNCSWGDAVVYYHTGPGFSNKDVQTAMSVNAPIVRHMKNIDNPTAQDYINGAKKYYGINEVV